MTDITRINLSKYYECDTLGIPVKPIFDHTDTHQCQPEDK